MKSRVLLPMMIILLSCARAHSLVGLPSLIGEGQWSVEVRSLIERGLVEPNENRDSFQSAEIDVHRISLVRHFGESTLGKNHFLRFDYSRFTSGREQVGNQLFYEKDTGNVATLTYGFDFVAEDSFSTGFYVSVSPLTDFNKDKFSVPRVDLWALGLRSNVALNSTWFFENSLQFGSGIPGKQNSYLAFTHFVGYKLAPPMPVTLKLGPYAELDLQDRTDPLYDAAFSAPGRVDRIRSMKVGTVVALEAPISSTWSLGAGYVQKLGGYDAPATNATYLSLGARF